jgi:hypothetical protein
LLAAHYEIAGRVLVKVLEGKGGQIGGMKGMRGGGGAGMDNLRMMARHCWWFVCDSSLRWTLVDYTEVIISERSLNEYEIRVGVVEVKFVTACAAYFNFFRHAFLELSELCLVSARTSQIPRFSEGNTRPQPYPDRSPRALYYGVG